MTSDEALEAQLRAYGRGVAARDRREHSSAPPTPLRTVPGPGTATSTASRSRTSRRHRTTQALGNVTGFCSPPQPRPSSSPVVPP